MCKPVCETCYKDCCETHYKECCETCYKECKKTICKPVTTCKTVTRKVKECCQEQYCVPGKTRTVWHTTPDECCFDPCTCKTYVKKGQRVKCCCKEPDQICTRNVYHTRTICESVPCTTMVKECVIERVPYTVVKKVPYTVVRKVPYTVTRMVPETTVKRVPYTVTRTVTEVVRTRVPYTVTRVMRGAWVDSNAPATSAAPGAPGSGCGCCTAIGHATEGPGRRFVEGACYERTWTTTSTRMVPVTETRKVQYTVWRTVTEQHVKRVPYTVVRMVPHTVKKVVPYTVCEMVQTRCVKKVPYTVCNTVPYTVHVKVPYTVTECVPVTVCKKVPVSTCVEVPVTRCRKVPVTVECCPAPCCPPCPPVKCEPCCTPCCPTDSCPTDCCEKGKGGWMNRLFRKRLACDTGCDSCATAAPCGCK